jgi:hypothetical protein
VGVESKKGVAKVTLKAKLTSGGKAVGSAIVWLQTSSSGTSWKNSYKLITNSAGSASKALSI